MTDRITDLSGRIIAEGLTFEEALAVHHRMLDAREPHWWQRWCGERTGYNTVGGYFLSSDNNPVSPTLPSSTAEARA